MSTKAQDFRNEEQKKKHNRPKQVKKPKRRERGAAAATMHEHTGARGSAKATVAIEESEGRASRKSTRASANGQKSGAVLEHVRHMRSSQPSSRRGRRGG